MRKVKPSDEMRPEYKLSDFKSPGIRGKYYKRILERSNVVVLDPDVARRFRNANEVNAALRKLINGADARQKGAARSSRARRQSTRR